MCSAVGVMSVSYHGSGLHRDAETRPFAWATWTTCRAPVLYEITKDDAHHIHVAALVHFVVSRDSHVGSLVTAWECSSIGTTAVP